MEWRKGGDFQISDTDDEVQSDTNKEEMESVGFRESDSRTG